MASESDTQSDVSSQPEAAMGSQPEKVIYEFGNAAISDVVFLVGGKQFRCHKMLLAAKCEYFMGMFTSGFKEKDQSMVEIDADPAAFKNLMDIIYNGRIENDGDLFMCISHKRLGIPCEQFDKNLWMAVTSVLALADRFLLTDLVQYSIECSLVLYDHKCRYLKGECYHCAIKLLLALRFNMEIYKEINESKKSMIIQATESLDERDLGLSSKALGLLLERD